MAITPRDSMSIGPTGSLTLDVTAVTAVTALVGWTVLAMGLIWAVGLLRSLNILLTGSPIPSGPNPRGPRSRSADYVSS
jgi:hypothetical protein